MKKIGLITIFDEMNFGNRLQNYALSYFINKKLKYKCITLVSDPHKSILFVIKQNIIYILSKTPLKKTISKNPIDWKYWRFLWFDRKYIPIKYYYGTYSIPSSVNKKFDCFLVGSDQVWNYNFSGRFGAFSKHKNDYFLEFADPVKRVSYAASFGTDEIVEKWRSDYKNLLSQFHYLSVRENEGKTIIEHLLIDKNVEIHIDPTLLLSTEEWEKVIRKPIFAYKKQYMFVYFLGEKEQIAFQAIEQIRQNKNLYEIDIMDKSNLHYFVSGPSEFLWWIKHSELVLTDSFHAIVFAIIFDRPFIVFYRTGMNSRIKTLLNKLHLESRLVENITSDNLYDNDYRYAKEIIHSEQKKSRTYLLRSLE